MKPKHKKIMLMLLVLPSGLFWGAICVLGIYVFFSDPQGGIRGYPLLLGSTAGLLSTLIAISAVFSFPRVGKITLLAYAAGCTALIAGAVAGLSDKILYFVSIGSLVVAGAILTRQFFRNRKSMPSLL
jgi:hypothetical protein